MGKQNRNTRSPLIPITHFLIFFFLKVYTIVKFCLIFVVYLIKVICFIHSCMMLTNSDIQAWWFSTTKHNTCSQNMESVFIFIWQIMKFFKNHTLQFQTQNEVTIQKTSSYLLSETFQNVSMIRNTSSNLQWKLIYTQQLFFISLHFLNTVGRTVLSNNPNFKFQRLREQSNLDQNLSIPFTSIYKPNLFWGNCINYHSQ